MKKPRVCCIFNIGPHYDFPLYQAMGETFGCDFYLGDRLPYAIKTLNQSQLTGFKKNLHNVFLQSFYWQRGALRLLFKPYQYYILNGEPFCLSTWIFLLLSKFTGKQVLGWTHGWYGREGFIKSIIKRTFYRLFDKLLIYNEYSMHLLEQQGIASERIFCFANSLDSDRIKAVREQLTTSDIYQEHFGNNNPVLIYCGRIQKRKKLDMLVDCVERLKTAGTSVNLMMVGADDEDTGIAQLVEEKGLTKNVWFYGPCYEESQLGAFFYNADICISPGNVGLTAIHALSYGCPVITHGDFPYQMPEFEAIRPDKTGAFFKRDDTDDLTRVVASWLQEKKDCREQIRLQAYQEIDSKWNIHYQIEILKKVLA